MPEYVCGFEVTSEPPPRTITDLRYPPLHPEQREELRLILSGLPVILHED